MERRKEESLGFDLFRNLGEMRVVGVGGVGVGAVVVLEPKLKTSQRRFPAVLIERVAMLEEVDRKLLNPILQTVWKRHIRLSQKSFSGRPSLLQHKLPNDSEILLCSRGPRPYAGLKNRHEMESARILATLFSIFEVSNAFAGGCDHVLSHTRSLQYQRCRVKIILETPGITFSPNPIHNVVDFGRSYILTFKNFLVNAGYSAEDCFTCSSNTVCSVIDIPHANKSLHFLVLILILTIYGDQ